MNRFRSVAFSCASVLLLIGVTASSTCFGQTSAAAELAKVLPDDVLGFVATSGGDSLKPGFEKSIVGRLWNDPSMQAFVKSIEQAVVPRIEKEIDDPEAAATIKDVLGHAKLVLGRPFAVGAARKPVGQGPPVYGFAILNAGPRKAEIAAALSKLEALADEGDIVDVTVGSLTMHGPRDADDVPLYWGWVGDYLVVAVNDAGGLAVKHLTGPRSAAPAYFSTVGGTDDALVVHCDIKSVVGIIMGLVEAEASSEDIELGKKVLAQLGVSDIKAVTARVGFAGPDVVVNSLLEMPAPRTGLFASLKPIGLAMFDAVDAGAMNATALNCDLGGIYDTILGAIKTAAGEDFGEVEQGIAAVESELNIKIRQGLLASLNGQMVFYSLPSGITAQSPMGGLVLVAGLRDAKLWEQNMGALGQFIASKSGGMVQVSSQVQGDKTVHTWAIVPLAMAQIMPTWTVVGDKVVIASSPIQCNGAVAQIESGTKSIRSTDGFKAATAKLPANVISLRYSDSKQQFTQLTTALQQFWPMAAMFAAKAEVQLPMILPNLSHIAQDMGASIEYSWFDEGGLRSRYRGPGIEPSLGAVAGSALGAGVLMPALARTRQQARHVVSMSNLKNIGLGLHMYASENNDKFPESFEQARQYFGSSKVFESPLKPSSFDGPCYKYVKGHTIGARLPAKQILVYENPEYLGDEITVLFVDGHVERMKRHRFNEMLQATYKQLGREMPEV